MERYACPIPFHVVRMRFLGNIATPQLAASPIETIKSLWGGELPEFDNLEAVNELFETMMSPWNELARHQSGTKPVRLARMAVTPDPDELRHLCQIRTEELEGFIDGLFGAEEAVDLPERANEALSHLPISTPCCTAFSISWQESRHHRRRGRTLQRSSKEWWRSHASQRKSFMRRCFPAREHANRPSRLSR